MLKNEIHATTTIRNNKNVVYKIFATEYVAIMSEARDRLFG